MANQGENHIKLGVFVLTGLSVLILSFYLIGKNHNLFGSNFRIRARFSNLNGLTEGNNVQFSGIQAGTVKTINMINDTTIEVTMLIDNKIKSFIRRNAIASIGTEGLMGNKIVNILPGKVAGPPVSEGDLLAAERMVSTDEMLQTLSKTNSNIAQISEAIKATVLKINTSSLMDLANDKRIGPSVRSSLLRVEKAAGNAAQVTAGLNELIRGIKNGRGAAGVLISDTALAGNLQMAILKIRKASDNADRLTQQLNSLTQTIDQRLNQGDGSLNVLLKDSVFAQNLKQTMENLKKGTDGFNQNMEALKHNFLFRGFFKKQEREKAKQK
ncbi:MlaD family protein [Mucilaginibacter sp. L3T2-6]|uniref:MlaD family protein n=1 Tax=Mucilaginibacter sp. L3T2-6 TaxID=3062491 RepID=UPI0026765B2B|nr:MlaD family protein [Mucilaginibacter sp. L3T2-6]MDO3643644.1 MlaD family protein [Mucilaginibacter sp. L3T2-6]MDV6216108.1 MlaD family protein [Mucilaginibacter sp. L3T2-6]